MGFGIRLRGLWQVRRWMVLCALFALTAAVWSVAQISLLPPKLSSRSLQMASASTQVIVDTQESTLVDIGQDKYGLEALTSRALLLGNVLATPEVRSEIARGANVPLDRLQVIPPLTPSKPRVVAEAGNEKHTTDIFTLNDEYRLYVRANPSVPFLDIYAETPSAESAEALANAAVGGTQAYLSELAKSTDTSAAQEIRLMQLGKAKGAVINHGIRWRVAILVFLLAFGVACATVVWARRVREGWRLAVLSEQGMV